MRFAEGALGRSLMPSSRSRIVSLLGNSSGCNGFLNRGPTSHIQSRSESVAATVSSDFTEPQRKRVPKHERRAMIESYVSKYRALNCGKFPSITCTQKEMGGSYYVVREILQEIEHSFKASSISKRHETSPGMTVDANLSRKAMKEVSQIVDEAAHNPLIVGGVSIKCIKDSVKENIDNNEQVDSKFCSSGNIGSEETKDKGNSVPNMLINASYEDLNLCSRLQASPNEHINEVKATDVMSVELSFSSDLSTKMDRKICHSAVSSDNLNEMDESADFFKDSESGEKASTSVYSSEQKSHEKVNNKYYDSDATVHGNKAEILDTQQKEREVSSESSDIVQKSERFKTKGFDDALERDSYVRDPPVESKDEEPGGIWKNLKSLADSIISFWRKS